MVCLPFFSDYAMPAGLIAYPLTFFLSDLVTEVYGPDKAKRMVYLTFGMSFLSFLMIKAALWLPSSTQESHDHFHAVLGLNGVLLFGSLTAYLCSQTIDIQLYTWIKTCTGPSHLWVRNNGSTLIAQLFDTLIVNTIHLHFGAGIEFSLVIPIIAISYFYKFTFNLLLTPFFYLAVFFLNKTPSALWSNIRDHSINVVKAVAKNS
jgi:hypothetical protein